MCVDYVLKYTLLIDIKKIDLLHFLKIFFFKVKIGIN